MTLCASHHLNNCVTACAYAARVFLLRMFALKNSMKRHDARSPASTMARGSFKADATELAAIDWDDFLGMGVGLLK
jgi:hypothetical protein